MIRRWTICFAGLAAFVVVPLTAHAAIKCSVTTVGVAFGFYDVFSSAPLDSAGSVTIRCTGLGTGVEPITVALSAGGSGSFQLRTLIRGSDRMSYNLYLDAGRGQIWGDGTGGSLRYASVSRNQPVILTIFGRIPPGQDVSAGTYSDTIVVTVNF
jgi:spore coat protein U-like protein